MPIKVVTDSASDLPVEIAESLDITIVPCIVNFGTESYKDGVDLPADDFYDRLTSGSVFPTTSQPSPGDFAQVYDAISQEADGIVSIHLSSKLSRTYESAVQGKGESKAECPIEVLDSAQASMGIGMVAMAAARAAGQGASFEEVARAARAAAGRSQLYFLLDTLEYLQRGGRIGNARALVGSLLNIKPMLIVREGEVQELGKARTFPKGIAKLQDVTKGYAPLESVCVLHTTTPDLAREVAESIGDLLPEDQEPFIARTGPTVGAHVGPGVIGVGLLQAEGSSPPGD